MIAAGRGIPQSYHVDEFIDLWDPPAALPINTEASLLRDHMHGAFYRTEAPKADDLIHHAPDGLHPAARARVGKEAVRLGHEVMLMWAASMLDEQGWEVVP